MGEPTSVWHAVLFGSLAAVAGLANPPLASLALIYVCGLASTTTLSRTGRWAAISVTVTAVCFLSVFFLASGIISRTGAGYRSLSLSIVTGNESVEGFAEGFVHVDSYASWAHFASLDAIATTLLSFLLYSVVAPLPSLTDNLTMADMGGYFSSATGILLLTTTSGFLFIGLVKLGASIRTGATRDGLVVRWDARVLPLLQSLYADPLCRPTPSGAGACERTVLLRPPW